MTSDLLERLPEMEREAAEYEAKARALRQIVEGVRALNGHAAEIREPRFLEQNGTVFVAPPLDPRGPRGREAVRRVMATEPGRLWKVIELKREILRRGWAPSPKAVEATLKRMLEAGDLASPRYGYYCIPSSPALVPAPPLDDHTSDRPGVIRIDGARRESSGGPHV